MMTGAANQIDVQVDMRDEWRGVRDQGRRMSCLACATSDAHAHCHSLDQSLSAEFLFFHAGQAMPANDVSQGVTFDAVDHALQFEGQPDETEWPYSTLPPNPWTPPVVSTKWYGTLTEAGIDVKAIFGAVQAQRPVVLGVKMTMEFIDLKTPPYITSALGPAFGGHAVLAVGLGSHTQHGEVVLVRNSWGDKWGDCGCGWVSSTYLEHNLIGSRIVEPITNP